MANYLPFLLTLGTIQPAFQQQSTQISLHAQQSFLSDEPAPEITGPFRTVYSWKLLDFEFPSDRARLEAIASESFIQENNLPLGIETWKDRIFLSMPKWKTGVPATLAWLPRRQKELSPKLMPYPNWEWHTTGNFFILTRI